MSRHKVARAPIALFAAVVMLLALALPASAQDTTRLEGGETPVSSAIAWSQLSFTDGSAPTVIIARDDEFADALGSGAVQGLLQAPLLLTATDALSPETAAEITRLGSSSAIVLGGVDAVGPVVITELEALGLETERIGGPTRIETAVLIVERFFPSTTDVILARAFGTETDPTQAFADSLVTGPFGAATNTPSLLTATDSLDGPTAAALGELPIQRVQIVGGTDAVSEGVADEVEAALSVPDVDGADQQPGTSVTRIDGPNRWATAVQMSIALGNATAADASRILLFEAQSDTSWTSGFPAGVQTGNGAAVLLANGDSLTPETTEYVTGAARPLICGPGVSQAACDAAEAAINE
ncbi:cell wall-binding repeat-containing protein [Euzebya tangerina]|uniref:cell wall-binding repeat-containing protein n=1 Tax=Euzebya tangerina TaxID=591198 RepID=UPI000E31A473|nr:cell wall-binding repeat-containing protein [Euzebya tangerina]